MQLISTTSRRHTCLQSTQHRHDHQHLYNTNQNQQWRNYQVVASTNYTASYNYSVEFVHLVIYYNQALRKAVTALFLDISFILWLIDHITRGSHLYVACRSICDHNEVFGLAKSVLDCLIVPFWGSWSLNFQGSKVKLQLCTPDCWSLAVQRSPWSHDRPPKRALIT